MLKLFNKKDETKRLLIENNTLKTKLANSDKIISLLRKRMEEKNTDESMVSLMRDALGFPEVEVDFSLADKKGMPKHYLSGLDEDERKRFTSEMSGLYRNKRLRILINYMINLFAYNAIYKQDTETMKNNQIGVVAFRMFLKELEKNHKEFVGDSKDEEEFDDQELLPE